MARGANTEKSTGVIRRGFARSSVAGEAMGIFLHFLILRGRMSRGWTNMAKYEIAAAVASA